MKAFLEMKLSPQSRRKNHTALTSYYIGLQKMKKGTLFFQLALVRTRQKRVPFFLSILLSLKKIGKGVKFQDITPIREHLQTHLPMTLIMAILLVD